MATWLHALHGRPRRSSTGADHRAGTRRLRCPLESMSSECWVPRSRRGAPEADSAGIFRRRPRPRSSEILTMNGRGLPEMRYHGAFRRPVSVKSGRSSSASSTEPQDRNSRRNDESTRVGICNGAIPQFVKARSNGRCVVTTWLMPTALENEVDNWFRRRSTDADKPAASRAGNHGTA